MASGVISAVSSAGGRNQTARLTQLPRSVHETLRPWRGVTVSRVLHRLPYPISLYPFIGMIVVFFVLALSLDKTHLFLWRLTERPLAVSLQRRVTVICGPTSDPAACSGISASCMPITEL